MTQNTKLGLEEDLKSDGIVTAAIPIAAPDDVTKDTMHHAVLQRAISEQGGDVSKMIVSIHAHAHRPDAEAEAGQSHIALALASAPLRGDLFNAPEGDIQISG